MGRSFHCFPSFDAFGCGGYAFRTLGSIAEIAGGAALRRRTQPYRVEELPSPPTNRVRPEQKSTAVRRQPRREAVRGEEWAVKDSNLRPWD
jgi:hypothetical protein